MKFSNLRALAHSAIALVLVACGGGGGDGGIGHEGAAVLHGRGAVVIARGADDERGAVLGLPTEVLDEPTV